MNPAMHYGVNVPNFGWWAEPANFVELAGVTEAAGWEGLFVWDHLIFSDGLPLSEPWVLLAAAATVTRRIRLGPMVTPLPRRRPWEVARQATTLDRLSNGRLILGVGLGFPPEKEFGWFGGVEDTAIRAEMLDESLEIIRGLWSGEPFAFSGRHYDLHEMTFQPVPVQQPGIPIWVAGSWPNRAPFRRAARHDGVFPLFATSGGMELPTPAQLAEITNYVGEYRGDPRAPFDVVLAVGDAEVRTASSDMAQAYHEAGATWVHVFPEMEQEPAAFLESVAQGPPRG